MNAIPTTKNSPFKGSDNNIDKDNDYVLGHPDENNYELIVFEINVERLTKEKCEYLQKLAEEYGATVLSLQKTHITPNTDTSKFNICGFKLTCHHQYNKYGLSIYIKSNIS